MRTEDLDNKPLEGGSGFHASVLMIGGEAEAAALRAALGSPDQERFELAAVGEIDEALDTLRDREFDAVLLDWGLLERRRDATARLRGVARGAPLILSGGEAASPPGVGTDVDEWLPSGDSPGSVLRSVRGVVENRRLRDELRARTTQLEESEARFRSIIERTVDGIVIVDEDGKVRFVNPGAELMFGQPAGDLLGQNFGLASLSGETTEMDIVRGSDSPPTVAELRASSTTWEGEPAQVISLRDITDRKDAEERGRVLMTERAAREQAEEAGRRFRFLADAGEALDSSLSPDVTLLKLAHLIVPRMTDWCVIDLAEPDRIRRVAGVHADPGKQELLDELKERFPPNPTSPQPSVRVLRSGEPELYRGLTEERMRELTVDADHVDLLLRLGTRSSITVPLDSRDHRLGTITFVCGSRDFDETDVALAREIASRAARALDNARLYEAALGANRAKSDFLAVMSHELRTPLNAILGYTDLMLAGVAGTLDDVQGGYLGRVRASALHLLELIGDILNFAHTAEGRVKVRASTTRIGSLADEVVAIGETLVRDRGLAFEVEVLEPHETIHSDAGKLRQIALNLLANAAKFTESGSVGFRAEVEGDELVIAVSDTGIGMTAAEQEKIFEPFLQVEQAMTRRVGGAGLGLTVSRGLARLLGGDLSVESEPGKGSVFTLRVPRRIEPHGAGDWMKDEV